MMMKNKTNYNNVVDRYDYTRDKISQVKFNFPKEKITWVEKNYQKHNVDNTI